MNIINDRARTTRRMFLLIAALFAVCGQLAAATSATPTSAPADRVAIQKRKMMIVRRGKIARQFPERRTAVVYYPVVSGLSDPNVLRKVRALLDLKSVFGQSLAEYRQDTWLTELDYKVNHNRDGILDITFRQEGVGAYPDSQSKHVAVNLKTGEPIKARDAFKASSYGALVEMVNLKLRAEVAETIRDMERQNDMTAEDKRSMAEQLNGLKFTEANLDDFSINAKGVTFLYDAGFPHAIQAFEPVGQYFFSHAELRPHVKADGPLAVFRR